MMYFRMITNCYVNPDIGPASATVVLGFHDLTNSAVSYCDSGSRTRMVSDLTLKGTFGGRRSPSAPVGREPESSLVFAHRDHPRELPDAGGRDVPEERLERVIVDDIEFRPEPEPSVRVDLFIIPLPNRDVRAVWIGRKPLEILK